jgi:hypothetical protein
MKTQIIYGILLMGLGVLGLIFRKKFGQSVVGRRQPIIFICFVIILGAILIYRHYNP